MAEILNPELELISRGRRRRPRRSASEVRAVTEFPSGSVGSETTKLLAYAYAYASSSTEPNLGLTERSEQHAQVGETDRLYEMAIETGGRATRAIARLTVAGDRHCGQRGEARHRAQLRDQLEAIDDR